MQSKDVNVINVDNIIEGLQTSQIITLSIETLVSVPFGVVYKKDLLPLYDFDLTISLKSNLMDQISINYEVSADSDGKIAEEGFYQSVFNYIGQSNVFGFDTYQDADPFFKNEKRRVTYFLDVSEIESIQLEDNSVLGVSSEVYFKNGQSVSIGCDMLFTISAYENKLIREDVDVSFFKKVTKIIKV